MKLYQYPVGFSSVDFVAIDDSSSTGIGKSVYSKAELGLQITYIGHIYIRGDDVRSPLGMKPI